MVKRVRLNSVLFETKFYGRYIRVAALDPVSGLETYSTGLRSMGEAMVKRSAERKLEYMVRKKFAQLEKDESGSKKGWIA